MTCKQNQKTCKIVHFSIQTRIWFCWFENRANPTLLNTQHKHTHIHSHTHRHTHTQSHTHTHTHTHTCQRSYHFRIPPPNSPSPFLPPPPQGGCSLPLIEIPAEILIWIFADVFKLSFRSGGGGRRGGRRGWATGGVGNQREGGEGRGNERGKKGQSHSCKM